MNIAAQEKLEALRALMAERGYAALIVPSADEYLGEYIPERNERLRWLTGFTGSAGVAVVTATTAAMFVDGRYTVQVRGQVPANLFEFYHLLEAPYQQWLARTLAPGSTVACDPRLHSQSWYVQCQAGLEAAGLTLEADAQSLIDAIWLDRPEENLPQALLLGEQFTGESSAAKRTRIAKVIASANCDAGLIFAPDSVSWLLNVRGTDMPQLPVLLSFALLDKSGDVSVFVDQQRLPEGFAQHVGEGVRVCAVSSFAAELSRYAQCPVLVDPATASAWAYQQIAAAGACTIAGEDPVLLPKACKNPVELAGAQAAHNRDAVAEIQFLAWLDAEVTAGHLHDEALLADKLYGLRAQGEHFHALSFDTISAAGPNAAMCHYNHQNGTPAMLTMNSVYLCDSGGQYLDGTTDITRTVAIGDPGDEIRRLFTLVLKGHIALATARFPHGTTGMQLDVLARQYLWSAGFDFDHGTGHGVGAFLSVHEGPQRISKTAGNVALHSGMILSDEPGYYRDEQFGIRCENLVVVRDSAFGQGETPMLEFETLTLVPFDTRLLDRALLNEAEICWLNDYHQRVAHKIGPLLGALSDAKAAAQAGEWLARATAPIAGL